MPPVSEAPSEPGQKSRLSTGAQWRYFLPLIASSIIGVGGELALRSGLARVAGDAETLAAYGVALGLYGFVSASVLCVNQAVLALARGPHSTMRLAVFASVIAGILSALLLVAGGWAPARSLVVQGFAGITDPASAARVGFVLVCIAPLLLLETALAINEGLLLRERLSSWVAAGAVARLGGGLIGLLALGGTAWAQASPLRLPIAAAYLSALSGAAALLPPLLGRVRPALAAVRDKDEVPSYRFLAGFFWPLALTAAMMGFSRPLINASLASGPNAAVTLAALTVVYPMAVLFYNWVNHLRTVPLAFSEDPDAEEKARRFSFQVVALSFTITAALFTTPLARPLLTHAIGVTGPIAEAAVPALWLTCGFPLAVGWRANQQATALKTRRTKAMGWSGITRIVAIVAALALFRAFGWSTAASGMAALLFGFFVEGVTVWLGLRR